MTSSKSNVTRRSLLSGAAGFGLAAVAAPSIIQAQSSKTLTINAYGGEFQGIFMKEVVEPFEKKFGVKVVYDVEGGGAAGAYAKIRASRGKPGFDIAHELTAAEIVLGEREKLIDKIPLSKVPNLANVWPTSRTLIPPEYGVVHTFQYTALLYNNKHVKTPDSWKNYWMPESAYDATVKGKLIAYDPGVNVLEIYAMMMAAKMLTGNPSDIEPVWDVLKKQKELVGQTVQTSAQATTYFANDQVWLSPYFSGRSGYYKAQGYPIDFVLPKEGTVGLVAAAAIPANAANKELAYEFLNFRLEKEIQKNFSLAYFSCPVRVDITDWPANLSKSLLTTADDLGKLYFPDNALIGKKRSEWTLRWKEIMAS